MESWSDGGEECFCVVEPPPTDDGNNKPWDKGNILEHALAKRDGDELERSSPLQPFEFAVELGFGLRFRV